MTTFGTEITFVLRRIIDITAAGRKRPIGRNNLSDRVSTGSILI